VTKVHSVIYGQKQDLNAFLTAERLISQISPFNEELFADKFARFVLTKKRFEDPDTEVLVMQGHFPNSWINTDPIRQLWRQFLANAISQGLQHETIILRGGTDQEYVKSSKSIGLLEIINEPKIQVNADFDQAVPVYKL
jgi:hypothetical protein